MTYAQVVSTEKSFDVNSNSPSPNYTHPVDHNLNAYLMTPETFYIFKGRKFKNFKGQTEQRVQSHLNESNTNKIYAN